MRPHFSVLHFLLPVQGSFAIAQIEILRENTPHPLSSGAGSNHAPCSAT
jgi:hypothetical protein